MSGTVSFSVYRIENEIDGKPVQGFNDAIKEPEGLSAFDLPDGFGFAARLFIAPPKKSQPPWRAFLEPAFGTLDQVEESVVNSAVLVARIQYEGQDCYFALPFGSGRYLLRSNCCTWNYGLRVALNAMYPLAAPDNGYDPARVRSVDSKTIASNVIYTRRQMARKAIFEDFGFNIQADQLKSITGSPVDDTQWGTRLTGASVLHLSPKIGFPELGPLLVKIEETHRRTDYQDQFLWIDYIRAVNNDSLTAKLDAMMLELVKDKDDIQVSLAPPHIVDWDRMDTFRYAVPHEKDRDDLDIADYRECLEEEGKLDELTVPQMRGMHTIEVLDGNGLTLYRWSVYNCLYAEIQLDEETYLLEGGNYFVISPDYLKELNDYINGLEESDIDLPTTTKDEEEGAYNEKVAQCSPDYLLLDKQTVRVSNKTSPIEICDILTSDGQFIHVKRKLASASLSHLFGQGYVSGDLLHTNPEYRQAVLEKIKCAEDERVESGDITCRDHFKVIDPKGIQPSKYRVVYAIAAPWHGRSITEALPFFSKVSLRHYSNDLQRLGFKVKYKRIEAT